MVYKAGKGGVRSGNTLRGLHSLRTRRYARQACIIGRSSLSTKDVTELVDSSTDDPLINQALKSTNVILSLNKQQRWRLPSTVSHMINSGKFMDGAMVSMLERHKLKRRANCVSFLSNKGRIRRMIPTQKRYFSFNLDHIDEEQSNRQRKKQLAEAMRKAKAESAKLEGGKKSRSPWKTVNVFTMTGAEALKGEGAKLLPSSKPEYRLEVFYPCPRSCSLAFNPKYTDVVLEEDEDGEMEVKSSSRPSKKSQRRHRKRFTAREVDTLHADMVNDDVEEMWLDELRETSDGDAKSQSLDSQCEDITEDLNDVSFCSDDDYYAFPESLKNDRSRLSENIFVNLIAEAERAKSLCRDTKHRQRKRSGRLSHDSNLFAENNSNLFYCSERDPKYFENKSLNAKKDKAKRHIEAEMPSKLEQDTHKDGSLSFGRSILSSKETLPSVLRENFGLMYSEADCKPRRFIINVTEDIQSLFSHSRSSRPNTEYTSYLVFIHEGFYDEGLEAYKVIFNSNVCKNTEQVSKSIPFQQLSISDIMNYVIGVLMDMKEDNLLDLSTTVSQYSKYNSAFDFLNDRLRVKVEAFHTSDEMNRASRGGAIQEGIGIESDLDIVAKDFDVDFFCEICYENINPTKVDAISGTQLRECGHLFCDECWRSHLRTKTRDGAIKLSCPGYQCDREVGPVTLLSLLHVSEVSQLLQRLREDELETSPYAKWCPNPDCGRVIRLDTSRADQELSLNVACACGYKVCFSCLQSAHWPASCEQAEDYMDKLYDIKVPKETADEPSRPLLPPPEPKPKKKIQIVEVEGRLCPKCQRFIEKNGGCPSMICKCGINFCWTCMKPFNQHGAAGCKIDQSHLFNHTRTVRVRHVIVPKIPPTLDPAPETTEKHQKFSSPRQKVTLYQRALLQRMETWKNNKSSKEMMELAMSVSNAARKDLKFKIEVLSTCGVDTQDLLYTDPQLSLVSVKEPVIRFLRSCRDIKLALHHVCEFTFVLLQDAPSSVEKRRVVKLANDLSGYCSFMRSILEAGANQDHKMAVKRLADIKTWAERALDILLVSVGRLRVVKS